MNLPVVDPKRYARYKAIREKFPHGVTYALQHMREEDRLKAWEDEFDVPYLDDKAKWKEGDFTFVVKFAQECDNEVLEQIGTYVASARSKVSRVHLGEHRTRPWFPKDRKIDYDRAQRYNAYDRTWGEHRYHDSRTCEYVVPQNTYSDYFNGLWEMGFSKSECDLRARRNWYADVKRMESYDTSWWAFGFQIKVFYDLTGDGPEEIAENTQWGYETDTPQEDRLATAYDVSREALAEAKDYLEKLRTKLCATLPATSVVK